MQLARTHVHTYIQYITLSFGFQQLPETLLPLRKSQAKKRSNLKSALFAIGNVVLLTLNFGLWRLFATHAQTHTQIHTYIHTKRYSVLTVQYLITSARGTFLLYQVYDNCNRNSNLLSNIQSSLEFVRHLVLQFSFH